MSGLSRVSGADIDPNSDEYVVTLVSDVLTTPIGTRVMLRAYGSHLPDLVDQPQTPMLRVRLYGATAMALLRWIKICRLKKVRLVGDGPKAALRLDLVRTDLPRPRALFMTLPLAAARP